AREDGVQRKRESWGAGEGEALSSPSAFATSIFTCRLGRLAGSSASGRLCSRRDWPGTPKLLDLQNQVRGKQGEYVADPDHGLHSRRSEGLPPGNSQNHAHFQKDQRNGKTARHPLTVLLDLSAADKSEGNCGRQNPGSRLHGSDNTEGSSGAHALLEVLHVESHRRGDEYAAHVDPSHYAMNFGEALTQAVRKLKGTKQERARSRDPVRQQVPAEGMIVLPYGVIGMNEKTFVVTEHIGQHEADHGPEDILRARAQAALKGKR